MVLDVYNQLLDRSKREHGAAFDGLLADARHTLYGPTPERQDHVSGQHSGQQAHNVISGPLQLAA
jgi:hypothetical protein